MASTELDLHNLERAVNRIEEITSNMNNNLIVVDSKVASVQTELEQLKREFVEMVERQQRNAVIQKATTELVRVRQEIQQKFGNYAVVRETMIGILQATDVALVRETTISRVSEELMISTPKYWLAPCLVAVAAWIGNDRALAERAIAESTRRDAKKTAITMALICRRNERTKTCFEWLNVYFQNVSPEKITEEDFAYVNAYASGVFGKDETNVCDEYITMWVEKITKGSSGFGENENRKWKEYCSRFKTDISAKYLELQNVPEFGDINEYVGRLEAVREVRRDFDALNSTDVDISKLREDIDRRLEILVKNVEEEEYELRDEETFYKLVKVDGDEEKARLVIEEAKRKREEETLNIIEQMSNTIMNSKKIAERKTALRFVNGFADKGMKDYLAEKTFPEIITVQQDGWSGKLNKNGSIEDVCSDYSQKMDEECAAAKAYVEGKSKTKNIVFAAIAGVVGIVTLLADVVLLGLICLGVAAYNGYKIVTFNKTKGRQIAEIDVKYSQLKEIGLASIRATGQQWKELCDYVNLDKIA